MGNLQNNYIGNSSVSTTLLPVISRGYITRLPWLVSMPWHCCIRFILRIYLVLYVREQTLPDVVNSAVVRKQTAVTAHFKSISCCCCCCGQSGRAPSKLQCMHNYCIHKRASQQTWDVNPMYFQCWTIVCDAGPTLKRNRVSVSCLLGVWCFSSVCSVLDQHLIHWTANQPRLK